MGYIVGKGEACAKALWWKETHLKRQEAGGPRRWQNMVLSEFGEVGGWTVHGQEGQVSVRFSRLLFAAYAHPFPPVSLSLTPFPY